MRKNFDLVVFDWDGTLMDSTPTIARAILAACRDLGLPEPSIETANHVIGLGLIDAMRYASPGLAETDYGKMVERYRHHYLASDQMLTLFPQVENLLDELLGQDKLLAVATGKSRVGLNRMLERTGLGARFHATRCADECFSKPHPQMMLEILDELGVEPSRAVMVGDTIHDIGMARAAGVGTLAVAYGAHPKSQLLAAEPLACVDTSVEMAQWLCQIEA